MEYYVYPMLPTFENRPRNFLSELRIKRSQLLVEVKKRAIRKGSSKKTKPKTTSRSLKKIEAAIDAKLANFPPEQREQLRAMFLQAAKN